MLVNYVFEIKPTGNLFAFEAGSVKFVDALDKNGKSLIKKTTTGSTNGNNRRTTRSDSSNDPSSG